MIDLPPAQIECIAEAIYFEARGENIIGQQAVGHIILNRSAKQGKPPCVIIKQPGQFVYKKHKVDKRTWERVYAIAQNLGEDPTFGATYFQTGKVKWKYKMTVRIGGHSFYK